VRLRKGATDAVAQFIREHRGKARPSCSHSPSGLRKRRYALAVADGSRHWIIHLKDVVKGNEERILRVAAMGIRTVMVTATIPNGSGHCGGGGVDDFIAQATEKKLDYIRKEQNQGRMVAMAGDAPTMLPLWPGRRRLAMTPARQQPRKPAHGGPDSNPPSSSKS